MRGSNGSGFGLKAVVFLMTVVKVGGNAGGGHAGPAVKK